MPSLAAPLLVRVTKELVVKLLGWIIPGVDSASRRPHLNIPPAARSCDQDRIIFCDHA
jgi:hypothetical protein